MSSHYTDDGFQLDFDGGSYEIDGSRSNSFNLALPSGISAIEIDEEGYVNLTSVNGQSVRFKFSNGTWPDSITINGNTYPTGFTEGKSASDIMGFIQPNLGGHENINGFKLEFDGSSHEIDASQQQPFNLILPDGPFAVDVDYLSNKIILTNVDGQTVSVSFINNSYPDSITINGQQYPTGFTEDNKSLLSIQDFINQKIAESTSADTKFSWRDIISVDDDVDQDYIDSLDFIESTKEGQQMLADLVNNGYNKNHQVKVDMQSIWHGDIFTGSSYAFSDKGEVWLDNSDHYYVDKSNDEGRIVKTSKVETILHELLHLAHPGIDDLSDGIVEKTDEFLKANCTNANEREFYLNPSDWLDRAWNKLMFNLGFGKEDPMNCGDLPGISEVLPSDNLTPTSTTVAINTSTSADKYKDRG